MPENTDYKWKESRLQMERKVNRGANTYLSHATTQRKKGFSRDVEAHFR